MLEAAQSICFSGLMHVLPCSPCSPVLLPIIHKHAAQFLRRHAIKFVTRSLESSLTCGRARGRVRVKLKAAHGLPNLTAQLARAPGSVLHG